ncbi:TIGR02147 family protein [Halobacteriovorax sp. HLS]|uniref:TIGR02147 family protein n=1 Tax=Halobacteriovorax sp. HLS TaxID=2234000 RepID=UPI000FD71A9F|nr:TIGR02147 family protein [Halobacteriovorax sp. HLS]
MIPRVIDYLDYREYLQDFFLAKKAAKNEYSYRVFNSKGGIKSPSHLKSIIDQKRNLTLKTIEQYTKSLDLKKSNEKNYFKLLVLYNQEKCLTKKEEIFTSLMEEKRKKNLTMVEQAQFNFLASWYNVVIYVLLDMGDFKLNDQRLIKILKNRISRKELEDAFSVLTILKLIKEDDLGFYRQTSGALSTSEDIRDMAIHKYHKNMNELAKQSLVKDDLGIREFNGATIPICREKLPLLKEKIRTFRKEINAMASSYAEPTHVYQLNIQLFPLTEGLS